MLSAVLIPTGMTDQDTWANQLGAGDDGVDTSPDLRESVIVKVDRAEWNWNEKVYINECDLVWFSVITNLTTITSQKRNVIGDCFHQGYIVCFDLCFI